MAKMAGHVVPDIRQHTLQIAPGSHNYDPYFSGYFLHSCEPNIFLDMENMKVIALADIAPGTYLTMDYAQTEDYLFRQFPCGCGAAVCRGWIHGRLEQPQWRPVNDAMGENDVLVFGLVG
ncbi:MAG: SET domain-containing protein-lysine N-methyltransferase [Pseudomonadales bacterium]|nr:SET domain-containing protein-lysine N-methyltransferase [Pseudomonadales bacterium]